MGDAEKPKEEGEAEKNQEEEEEDSDDDESTGADTGDVTVQQVVDFKPNVYTFILKDIFGNNVYLPPSELSNIRVSSPPFHLLLDHAIAVLWIMYSNKPDSATVLRSSHLHWVLAFLEGLKDRQNRHSADIAKIMEHIQTTLVNLYCQLDGDALEKRNNDKITEYTKLNVKGNRIYIEFEAALKAQNKNSTSESTTADAADPSGPPPTYEEDSSEKASTSLILQDMLENHPQKLHELLHVKEDCKSDMGGPSQPKEKPAEIPTEVLKWRDDQYQKLIEQINRLKEFDETLTGANCAPDLAEKLEAFLDSKQKKG